MRKKPENINELRDALLDSFGDLLSGNMRAIDAKERSNMAGKIINSAKIQLEYQVAAKREPAIEFLEGE